MVDGFCQNQNYSMLLESKSASSVPRRAVFIASFALIASIVVVGVWSVFGDVANETHSHSTLIPTTGVLKEYIFIARLGITDWLTGVHVGENNQGGDGLNSFRWCDNYRTMYWVNETFPGPLIDVMEGDTIRVTVKNYMWETSTIFHWHGMTQFGTPQMDGQPMVSQCPITQMESFTYEFTAYPAGSHFYRGLSSYEMQYGMVGPLIVRKKNDPFAALYSEEIMMFATDGYCYYLIISC
jgi:hypothetical protein